MSHFKCDPPGNWVKAEVAYALEAENKALKSAIRKTLRENAHLADGENCTLIALKHALKETR